MGNCNNCAEGRPCDGGGCDLKNNKNAAQARINALRRCEPFCTNGGCAVDRGDYLRRSPLFTFLNNLNPAKLAAAGFNVGIDPATGLPCIAVPGGACVPLCVEDPCRTFGPHANAARRRPSMSPDDIAAVKATYGYEEVTVAGPIPVPDASGAPIPGWGIVALGALGVSHKFCLREVSTETGAGVPIPVRAVRIAGARIVFDTTSPGSYSWAMDNSTGADPDDIDTTPERCACKNLCAWTPEEGLEFFLVQSDVVGFPAASDEITLKIERSDWLVEVDPCVPQRGSRLLYTAFTPDFLTTYRVTPGAIPALP